MRITQSSFLDFLSEPGVRFAIPRYQRRYSWQKRQCEELWLDIHRAAWRGKRHFAGTVLYEELSDGGGTCGGLPSGGGVCREIVSDSDSGTLHKLSSGDKDLRELSIIDGQQRITTVLLMLVALRNHLTANRIENVDGLTADDINRRFLYSMPIEALDAGCGCHDAPMKLALSRLDASSMRLAVEGAPISGIPSWNVRQNLEYFESLMQDESFDPRLLLQGLESMSIVRAQVASEDDAQAVFESLNSKGVRLSIADMVRNYLLASECHDDQVRFYIDYWTVIEGVFDPDPGSLRLDTMIKAWLSVRFPKVRARKSEDVYYAFKRYYDDEYAGDLEPVLRELRSFAMVWAENYRYHAVKKFKSMPWAVNGAQTLTSEYKLKKADNEEYAERVRAELRAMDRNL